MLKAAITENGVKMPAVIDARSDQPAQTARRYLQGGVVCDDHDGLGQSADELDQVGASMASAIKNDDLSAAADLLRRYTFFERLEIGDAATAHGANRDIVAHVLGMANSGPFINVPDGTPPPVYVPPTLGDKLKHYWGQYYPYALAGVFVLLLMRVYLKRAANKRRPARKGKR